MNYDKTNKKVLGKFKDELNSLPLEEFIGLRSKCYSLLYDKDKEKQTAKGTKSAVKRAYLRHHHYREVLDNLSTVRVKQNVIKSRHHQIGTYHQNKAALTAFDTKRWICDDGIHTLAYGHCDIGATNVDDDDVL